MKVANLNEAPQENPGCDHCMLCTSNAGRNVAQRVRWEGARYRSAVLWLASVDQLASSYSHTMTKKHMRSHTEGVYITNLYRRVARAGKSG